MVKSFQILLPAAVIVIRAAASDWSCCARRAQRYNSYNNYSIRGQSKFNKSDSDEDESRTNAQPAESLPGYRLEDDPIFNNKGLWGECLLRLTPDFDTDIRCGNCAEVTVTEGTDYTHGPGQSHNFLEFTLNQEDQEFYQYPVIQHKCVNAADVYDEMVKPESKRAKKIITNSSLSLDFSQSYFPTLKFRIPLEFQCRSAKKPASLWRQTITKLGDINNNFLCNNVNSVHRLVLVGIGILHVFILELKTVTISGPQPGTKSKKIQARIWQSFVRLYDFSFWCGDTDHVCPLAGMSDIKVFSVNRFGKESLRNPCPLHRRQYCYKCTESESDLAKPKSQAIKAREKYGKKKWFDLDGTTELDQIFGVLEKLTDMQSKWVNLVTEEVPLDPESETEIMENISKLQNLSVNLFGGKLKKGKDTEVNTNYGTETSDKACNEVYRKEDTDVKTAEDFYTQFHDHNGVTFRWFDFRDDIGN